MARTRTTPSVDTLLDLVAKAPWWAGALLAAASALALHGAAQVAVPFASLAAALASVLIRRKRAGTAVAGADDVLAGMTRRHFEALVAESFQQQGYQLADGAIEGADLALRKDRQTWLVHCKPWRMEKVDVDTVSAFLADVKARGAAGGFVVSSGRFTRDAVALASGKPVQLIAGPALQLLIRKVQSSRPVATPPEPPLSPPPASPAVAPVQIDKTTTAPPVSPTCPKCHSAMLKRKAGRGEHAGRLFWGCVMHPDCRGVRRISDTPPG